MRRSLLMGFVSTFAVASVALAATGRTASRATLGQAVSRTNAASLRYAMVISVARSRYPTMSLHVRGSRSRDSLFVHVRAFSSLLSDGTAVPGPQQSALLDGPFLYEGSPNGVAIAGKVRWLRVPTARIGQSSKAITAMHNLSPAPILRLLDEWHGIRTHAANGVFHGKVRWDDPIVQTALSGMAGGIQFRDVYFSATVGKDGYVHTITVNGRTADGSRTLIVRVRMFDFGRPLPVAIPGESTFLDQKTLALAE